MDLGTLGGDISAAHGINEAGHVVGGSYTSSGEIHAFLYESGNIEDLGTLGGDYSNTEAISNKGLIVGYSRTNSGELHAALWIPEPVTLWLLTAGSLSLIRRRERML